MRRKITFVVPGSREDVPKGEEFLYFEGGDSSTGHPVLDSGDVKDDLSLQVDTVSGAPVTDVLNVATKDIFSVGSNYDPPESIEKYQRGWFFLP